jgi:DNA-binding PadR family transcriptional regulator
MNNPLPEATHLQLTILRMLVWGPHRSIEIKQKLYDREIDLSDPSFYQLMKRIENSKWVTGKYIQKIVDGQIIRERVYTITDSGKEESDKSYRLYNP